MDGWGPRGAKESPIVRKTATGQRSWAFAAWFLPVLLALAIALLGQAQPSIAADLTAPFWPTGTPSLIASQGANFVRVGGAAGWSSATDTPPPFVGSYEVRRSLAAFTTGLEGEYLGTIESSTTPRRYDDYGGIPGENYYYSIVALDGGGNRSTSSGQGVKSLTTVASITTPGSEAPHDSYAENTSLCRDCHHVHGTPGPKLFRRTTQLLVCYTCHDGTGASTNIQTTFASRVSGHLLEDTSTVPGPGLTQVCSSCHAVHFDRTAKPKLYKTPTNGATVTGNNYTWCEACHNDAYDWVVPTYPYPTSPLSAAEPQRDASGYPTLGTYAGRTTYNNTTWNAHNPTTSTNVIWPSSGRSSGDCRNCHASHANTVKYDALLAAFRPSSSETTESDRLNGTYAELCVTCHDGSPATTNVRQFITYDATKTGDDYTGGHRIFTSGGNLPVGAPLPCYDCHNPHGTKGNDGSNPNKHLISDEQWSGIDTSTTAGVVNFCTKCHLPWEYTAGSGQPDANTIPAGQLTTIEGLDRRVVANKLSLPGGITAHLKANMTTPAISCYDCHGSSYSAPSHSTGYNVHRPMPGGASCTTCHALATDAVDGAPTRRAASTEFTMTAHHVVGGSVTNGDCGVCHSEGTAADGVMRASLHMNNAIDLRDPDTGTTVTAIATMTRDTTTKTIEPNVLTVQNNLCFKCHDAVGAASTLARAPGGTAKQPFSANSTDAPNIYDAFATSNNFHHAVRGAGTNSYCTSTTTNGGNVTMVTPWNQLPNEHNVVSCFDCHVTSAGHGATYQDSGRTNFATYSGQRDNCIRCHKATSYQSGSTGSRFGDHNRGNHVLNANAYGCRGCHAGYPNASSIPANGSPGNIHGANYTWPAGSPTSGIASRRFMYGGWLNGWTSGTCYQSACAHGAGRGY